MGLQRLAPFPRDWIAEPKTGRLGRSWVPWLTSLRDLLNGAPWQAPRVGLTQQGAAVAATTIPIASLTAGLYRGSYVVRVTQAATTSSSVAVTLAWVDGGIACQVSGAPLTSNTAASVQSGTVLMRVDQTGPIQYAVAYASVGATPMQYVLDLIVEQLPG